MGIDIVGNQTERTFRGADQALFEIILENRITHDCDSGADKYQSRDGKGNYLVFKPGVADQFFHSAILHQRAFYNNKSKKMADNLKKFHDEKGTYMKEKAKKYNYFHSSLLKKGIK